MTKVLIAVDASTTSVDIARSAYALFGDAAEYLVVNVDPPIDDAMSWGAAYPLAMPLLSNADDPSAMERAEHVAADVAAALPAAESLGEVGDPAHAIIEAAHHHAVDVIVVGSHEHSWFTRLFTGSVSNNVLREADIPVLVVK